MNAKPWAVGLTVSCDNGGWWHWEVKRPGDSKGPSLYACNWAGVMYRSSAHRAARRVMKRMNLVEQAQAGKE